MVQDPTILMAKERGTVIPTFIPVPTFSVVSFVVTFFYSIFMAVGVVSFSRADSAPEGYSTHFVPAPFP